jgi:hypothetical protein
MLLTAIGTRLLAGSSRRGGLSLRRQRCRVLKQAAGSPGVGVSPHASDDVLQTAGVGHETVTAYVLTSSGRDHRSSRSRLSPGSSRATPRTPWHYSAANTAVVAVQLSFEDDIHGSTIAFPQLSPDHGRAPMISSPPTAPGSYGSTRSASAEPRNPTAAQIEIVHSSANPLTEGLRTPTGAFAPKYRPKSAVWDGRTLRPNRPGGASHCRRSHGGDDGREQTGEFCWAGQERGVVAVDLEGRACVGGHRALHRRAEDLVVGADHVSARYRSPRHGTRGIHS